MSVTTLRPRGTKGRTAFVLGGGGNLGAVQIGMLQALFERDITPDVLADVVRHKNIIDGRNVLNPDTWRDAGWHFRALGRP